MKGGTEFAKRLRTYVDSLRRGRGRSTTTGPRCPTVEQEVVLAVLTLYEWREKRKIFMPSSRMKAGRI